MEQLTLLILRHSAKSGVLTLLIGLGGGAVVSSLLNDWTFFGRFGAITTALGVLIFGCVSSHLTSKSHEHAHDAPYGDAPFPYNKANISKFEVAQTVVVIIGTLQWGFGDLLERTNDCGALSCSS